MVVVVGTPTWQDTPRVPARRTMAATTWSNTALKYMGEHLEAEENSTRHGYWGWQ